MTIAKGIADGFPMGMCAARGDAADAFQPGDHGSTFGGSCLAVAAAKATLETLVRDDVASNVEEMGAYLRGRLAELEHVVEVRGFRPRCSRRSSTTTATPTDIVARALGEGLLLNATGPRTLRFLPPLICGKSHVGRPYRAFGTTAIMANATKGGVAMAATKASTRRQQRQEAIRGIVRAEGVKTQRDLADKLHEAGFKCTQATVSRDIVEMGLKKAPDGCYALPEEERLGAW